MALVSCGFILVLVKFEFEFKVQTARCASCEERNMEKEHLPLKSHSAIGYYAWLAALRKDGPRAVCIFLSEGEAVCKAKKISAGTPAVKSAAGGISGCFNLFPPRSL
jgi:hypothetical protein